MRRTPSDRLRWRHHRRNCQRMERWYDRLGLVPRRRFFHGRRRACR